MDINLFYTILDYQKKLRYSAVLSELQGRRSYVDRYIVTSEPDPFFSRLSRRLPTIPVSTIVDRVSGFVAKLEPSTVNRRNRDMDLYRYVRV